MLFSARADGPVSGRGGFGFKFLEPSVPIDPTQSPFFARKLFARRRNQSAQGWQVVDHSFAVAPIEIGFEQAKAVIRIIRTELNCSAQVQLCFAATADAGWPAGRVLIEKAQRAMGTGV